jgi:hypothetical protein
MVVFLGYGSSSVAQQWRLMVEAQWRLWFVDCGVGQLRVNGGVSVD